MIKMIKNIHHIGIVVNNANKASLFYKKLGFKVSFALENDIYQKVRVRKIFKKNFIIELIEPTEQDSPIINFLKKGEGVHHVCYGVESIAGFEKIIRKNKLGRKISKCTPSVFGNNMIQFFYVHNLGLIEVIEEK